MPSTKPLFDKLMQEARGLFPQWNEPELHKWVHARLYAAKCKPTYGQLMPASDAQYRCQALPWANEPQFTARTRRQAGLR